MACCGSNSSSFGEGGSSIAQPIGLPDGSLAPIHPSWLNPLATIDPSLISDGITRTVTDGTVRLVINPGPNQFVVLGIDRMISTAKRQMFWGQHPGLASTIEKVSPPIPLPVPPTKP
jgi:hypothetical protein